MLFKVIMVNNASSNRKLTLMSILVKINNNTDNTSSKNKNKIFPSNCQEDAPKPRDELRLVRSRKKAAITLTLTHKIDCCFLQLITV